MRIATLQFAPRLGDVEGNIRRVNELLRKGKSVTLPDRTHPVAIGVDLMKPDILVLPELALTGMFSVERCVYYFLSILKKYILT